MIFFNKFLKLCCINFNIDAKIYWYYNNNKYYYYYYYN